MIVDERLVTYINSLDTGNTRILDAVEREALDSYVPIIRKEMQSFLKLLLARQNQKEYHSQNFPVLSRQFIAPLVDNPLLHMLCLHADSVSRVVPFILQ